MDIKEIKIKIAEAENKVRDVLISLVKETSIDIRTVNVSTVRQLGNDYPIGFNVEIETKI